MTKRPFSRTEKSLPPKRKKSHGGGQEEPLRTPGSQSINIPSGEISLTPPTATKSSGGQHQQHQRAAGSDTTRQQHGGAAGEELTGGGGSSAAVVPEYQQYLEVIEELKVLLGGEVEVNKAIQAYQLHLELASDMPWGVLELLEKVCGLSLSPLLLHYILGQEFGLDVENPKFMLTEVNFLRLLGYLRLDTDLVQGCYFDREDQLIQLALNEVIDENGKAPVSALHELFETFGLSTANLPPKHHPLPEQPKPRKGQQEKDIPVPEPIPAKVSIMSLASALNCPPPPNGWDAALATRVGVSALEESLSGREHSTNTLADSEGGGGGLKGFGSMTGMPSPANRAASVPPPTLLAPEASFHISSEPPPKMVANGGGSRRRTSIGGVSFLAGTVGYAANSFLGRTAGAGDAEGLLPTSIKAPPGASRRGKGSLSIYGRPSVHLMASKSGGNTIRLGGTLARNNNPLAQGGSSDTTPFQSPFNVGLATPGGSQTPNTGRSAAALNTVTSARGMGGGFGSGNAGHWRLEEGGATATTTASPAKHLAGTSSIKTMHLSSPSPSKKVGRRLSSLPPLQGPSGHGSTASMLETALSPSAQSRSGGGRAPSLYDTGDLNEMSALSGGAGLFFSTEGGEYNSNSGGRVVRQDSLANYTEQGGDGLGNTKSRISLADKARREGKGPTSEEKAAARAFLSHYIMQKQEARRSRSRPWLPQNQPSSAEEAFGGGDALGKSHYEPKFLSHNGRMSEELFLEKIKKINAEKLDLVDQARIHQRLRSTSSGHQDKKAGDLLSNSTFTGNATGILYGDATVDRSKLSKQMQRWTRGNVRTV